MKAYIIAALLALAATAQDASKPPGGIQLTPDEKAMVDRLVQEQDAASQRYRAARAELEAVRLGVCLRAAVPVSECGPLNSTEGERNKTQ